MKNIKALKWAVFGTIIAILLLTVLEFPTPIGFEVRSQDNVSPYWLILFLTILVSEISIILLIFSRPLFSAKLAIFAAALNIIQIFADQLHLMQPEIAPVNYLILEDTVGLLSLILVYFSCKIISIINTENKQKTI